MMRFITAFSLSAILALAFMSPAQADPVGGSQYETENGCFALWWAPFIPIHLDCSYDASKGYLGAAWTGPLSLWTYNGRLRHDGDISVTGGDAAGIGATVSGTLTMAAGSRVASCGAGSEVCTESWDSITHTLAPIEITGRTPAGGHPGAPSQGTGTATTNASGGLTYEVAANAIPIRLQPCVPYFPFSCENGYNFANERYPSVTPSPDFPFTPLTGWVDHAVFNEGPSANDGEVFQGPHFRRNVGTTSTAVASNYSCVQVGGEEPFCTSSALIGGSLGYENVLLKIDTNVAGGIINAEMWYTHEYQTLFGSDSWAGNIVQLSGFVAMADRDVKIDRKNPLNVTVYGSAKLDVRSIDIDTLTLAGGLYGGEANGGTEMHGKGHYGDFDGDGNEDLKAHFASNEADLRCGINEATLSGISDDVAFATTVTYNGKSNKLDDMDEPICP